MDEQEVSPVDGAGSAPDDSSRRYRRLLALSKWSTLGAGLLFLVSLVCFVALDPAVALLILLLSGAVAAVGFPANFKLRKAAAAAGSSDLAVRTHRTTGLAVSAVILGVLVLVVVALVILLALLFMVLTVVTSSNL